MESANKNKSYAEYESARRDLIFFMEKQLQSLEMIPFTGDIYENHVSQHLYCPFSFQD